jgi:eukaryotic-like serine/threonine-protein kinase
MACPSPFPSHPSAVALPVPWDTSEAHLGAPETDLPSVQSLYGRVLANRYLPESITRKSAFRLTCRAHDLAIDQTVLMEIMSSDLSASDWERSLHMLKRLGALGNPHIVETLGWGKLRGQWPFLGTEGWQGQDLMVTLAATGGLELPRVVRVGKQIAAGLQVAHDAGLLHGGLAPDQILVMQEMPGVETVKIGGWGLAPSVLLDDPALVETATGRHYLSPEHVSGGQIDARSDVYALGAVLYELITGSPLFAGVPRQHPRALPDPPSAGLRSRTLAARALDKIVQRCLHELPERRYQTAWELGRDLARLEQAAFGKPMPSAPARAARQARPSASPPRTCYDEASSRPGSPVPRPSVTIHTPARKLEALRAERKVIIRT